MKLYSTVRQQGEAELVIERSRFIAHVKPVSSREEAEAFIAEIRKRFRDATHNVPALVLGDKFQLQWASDDGEPQGTSGAPMVQLLVSMGITDTAVVVTRYFGGIKLGTGGLVRAYTSAAKAALEEAGICDVCRVNVIRAVLDYSSLSRLEKAAGSDFTILAKEYAEKVIVTLSCEPEASDRVLTSIGDMTAGRAEIISISEEIVHR